MDPATTAQVGVPQPSPVVPSVPTDSGSVLPQQTPLPQTEIPLPQASVASDASVLAQPIMGQVSAQVPPQAVSSTKSKETGPISSEVSAFVEVAASDSVEQEPLPLEVAGWMEKVNRDPGPQKLPEVVVADATANAPTGNYASQPVFVLPLGESDVKQGSHSSVQNSVRWLAEWCKRLMKKLGGQVAYNEA